MRLFTANKSRFITVERCNEKLEALVDPSIIGSVSDKHCDVAELCDQLTQKPRFKSDGSSGIYRVKTHHFTAYTIINGERVTISSLFEFKPKSGSQNLSPDKQRVLGYRHNNTLVFFSAQRLSRNNTYSDFQLSQIKDALYTMQLSL